MSRTVFFNEVTCPVKPLVEEVKQKYPKGTIIECLKSKDPFHYLKKGMIGIVTRVDDRGQIRMKWEDNSTFALDPETDLFVIYGGKK